MEHMGVSVWYPQQVPNPKAHGDIRSPEAGQQVWAQVNKIPTLMGHLWKKYIKLEEGTRQEDHEACKQDVARIKQELALTRRELQTSRDFFSNETVQDGKTLLDITSQLNQEIKTLAFLLVPFHLLDNPVHNRLFEDFVQYAKKSRVPLSKAIQYATQHEICTTLRTNVFSPFVPGISTCHDNCLRGLYHKLCCSYPQSHAARWRSMTYASMRSEGNDWSNDGKELIRHLLENIKCPSTNTNTSASQISPQDLVNRATSLFEKAVGLQDKIKTLYLSYEYEVFVVDAGHRFDATMMTLGNNSEREGASDNHVVWALGFGLKAWELVCNDIGGYVKKASIQLRVPVLTEEHQSIVPM